MQYSTAIYERESSFSFLLSSPTTKLQTWPLADVSSFSGDHPTVSVFVKFLFPFLYRSPFIDLLIVSKGTLVNF